MVDAQRQRDERLKKLRLHLYKHRAEQAQCLKQNVALEQKAPHRESTQMGKATDSVSRDTLTVSAVSHGIRRVFDRS